MLGELCQQSLQCPGSLAAPGAHRERRGLPGLPHPRDPAGGAGGHAREGLPSRPAGTGLTRKPWGCRPPTCLSAPHARQPWGCCVLPGASLAPPEPGAGDGFPEGKAGRAKAFLKGPWAFSPPGSWHQLYQALFLERSRAPPGRGPGWEQCSKGAGMPLLGAHQNDCRLHPSLPGLAAVPKACVLWPPRCRERLGGWGGLHRPLLLYSEESTSLCYLMGSCRLTFSSFPAP